MVFSKLFKYSLSKLREIGISKVISYSDNMLFSGNMYSKIKMVGPLESDLPPDYKIFLQGNTLSQIYLEKGFYL